MDLQNLLKKLLLIFYPMNLPASNDDNMAFLAYAEERNWKIPLYKTLLSLTCLRTNTGKSYSIILKYIKSNLHYENYKDIAIRKENYGDFTYVLHHLTESSL